ncbi:MAG: MATE family efflux transporter [Oscillospiraceae bacterium]|nr:MATE family efflux transporter [Oscillospiraceae bacterium]
METQSVLKRHFDRRLLPDIFSLAWPTMFDQLLGTAVQYIDMMMVGTLGTMATAAVGSTTTVSWLVGGVVNAIGVGFLAYISQAIGAEEKDRAARASSQAVTMTLIVGLLATAVTLLVSGNVPKWMHVAEEVRETAAWYFRILYAPMLFRAMSMIFGTVLRAAGDAKTPMRAGVAMNICNVILNALLIYPTRVWHGILLPGAGWGVLGAAAASAVSFVLGGTIMAVVLWRHPSISPRGGRFRPDSTILKPCLKVAMPNMLQRFCTSLGYVVFASMINALGSISTAAHTIANTVESFFYVPGFGMMTAAATLVGNAIGAKDKDRVRRLSGTITVVEIGLMIVSGGLLFAFAPALVGLFSKDPEVIRLGSRVLRMVALSEPFYGATIVTEGMLMGAGQTTAPFIFNTSCMWLIRIVGTLICTRFLGYGLVSAWACMIAHNMALLIIYRLYYHFGRWNPMEKNKAAAG